MKRPLIVIVSTGEALKTALDSDLSAVLIAPSLSMELGTELPIVMEAAGFRHEPVVDPRGTLYIRPAPTAEIIP